MLKVFGRVESIQRRARKSSKKMGKALSVFTETMEKLKVQKDNMLSVIADNNRTIAEINEANGVVIGEMAKIDNVISNFNKILGE